jgi:hypothetical protein
MAAAPAAPLGALLQDVAAVLPGHGYASVIKLLQLFLITK